MSVYFDSDRHKWRYDFVRGGKRYSNYCLDKSGNPVKSKRAAEASEANEKAKIEFSPEPARAGTKSIAEIVADLHPKWEDSPFWPVKQGHVREMLSYFGSSAAVTTLSTAKIDDYAQHLLKQPIRVWIGGPKTSPEDLADERNWRVTDRRRKPSTVNRAMDVVREVLTRASKMKDPATGRKVLVEKPEVTKLHQMKRKPRPIPESVFAELVTMLPAHTVEALNISLMFGFRQSEAFGLQIPDVDFDTNGVWLKAEDVKDSEDAFLPGSETAMSYLRKLVDQARARNATHLITYRPANLSDERKLASTPWRPIKRSKTAWATAMKKVEAKFGRKYRWHDIRAAFITHVVLTAGPAAAQWMARHSSFRTTQGYIEVAAEALRPAADKATERPVLALLAKKDEQAA